jgi:iron complex transport system permease protein
MLALGDDEAAASGVRVHVLRVETFVFAGLMTAAAVALSGPIGFLGLIVPHIARLLLGPDHRRLALACGFAGAMFLMLADTLCRTAALTRFGELPVGIITAFCGGPFFLYLLRRRGGEGEL